jgi:cytochrome c-type biogenesis protein CcmF
VIIAASLSLFILRFSLIKPSGNIKTFSKQSFISINNIFFGTLIFSVMLGVVYPLIYEYLYDQKISVGAPFYNAIFIPIVILASLFLFFSVDSKWSRSINFKIFTKPIVLSLIFSVISTFAIYFVFKTNNVAILLSIFVGLLVIIRYLIEVSISLIFKKYLNPFSAIAHFALGLLLVSISFNSLLSTERALNIKINEFEEYKDLTIYFKDIRVRKGSNFDAVKAEFNIKDKNGNNFDLSPEKRRYFTRGQITTETAIHVSPLKDIYLTIGDQLEDGSWIVNVQINFLIRWIWFSACLMAFAGIVLVSTNRKSNI